MVLIQQSGQIATEVFLVLDWMVAFLYLELGLIFLLRVLKNRYKIEIIEERGYFWVFFGYSFMWIGFIAGQYYITDPQLVSLAYNISYFSLFLSGLLFIHYVEREKVIIRKNLFTYIFIGFLILFLLFFLFAFDYIIYLTFLIWPFFLVFYLLYLRKLGLSLFKLRGERMYFLNYLKFFFSSCLLLIGYLLTLNFIQDLFGPITKLIGDIFQIIAAFIFYSFVISIPSFSEYNWKQHLKSIVIMHNSGLFIYKKNFSSEDQRIDDSIMSGVITMLKMMLEKVSENESLSVIEEEDNVIIIQPGKYLFAVLISDVNLELLQIVLRTFLDRIETIFSGILESWRGDLKALKPIDIIANEIFE